MNFGLKQVMQGSAAFVLLLALLQVGWAQTPTPAAPPVAAAPPAQIDRSLRCEDTKSVALAREESRHQQALQRLDYQGQRNTEYIQRARFSCSRRSPQSSAACEAGVVGRERRYAEQLDYSRAREDANNAEMLRRIEATAQVCASRYGGGSTVPMQVVPSEPSDVTLGTTVPPGQAVPVMTVPTPTPKPKGGIFKKFLDILEKGQQAAGVIVNK